MSLKETQPQTEIENSLNTVDRQYHALLEDILKNGQLVQKERTGTGTRKVFGRVMEFDLQEGFPLLTTKKVNFDFIKKELTWFISGSSNLKPLVEQEVPIWDEWPYKRYLEAQGVEEESIDTKSSVWKSGLEEFKKRILDDKEFAHQWGDLGPIYGYQWRHWKTPEGNEIDQLFQAVEQIKTNPFARDIIVNAWHPGVTDRGKVALPPCHILYQFNVNPDTTLDCAWYQRSVDTFLGLPFNIASYATLTHIVAQCTNLKPGKLTFFGADTHLYLDHMNAVEKQLERNSRSLPPQLSLNPNIRNIDDFTSEDIEVVGYLPHPYIYAPISV